MATAGLRLAALGAWLAAAVICAAAEKAGPGWPQWRGPNRNAVCGEAICVWPPEILWQFDAGSGVSSVIAGAGRVYAMGHRDGQDTVFCLDAETGKVVWRFSYPAKGDQTSDVRFPGPRSTPATDGTAVYALSLEGRVHCLDAASGKLLWTRSPAETGASDKQQYGVCCPVLVHEQMVICDVATRCVALEKTTGKLLWQTAGGAGWNGAAPVVARFGQQTCMVHGAGRCVELSSGRELWRVPYGEMSVATPVVCGERVFLAPFHGRNYGGAECAVVQSSGGPPKVVWKNDEVQGLCLTAVLWQGYLYAPDRDDLSLAGESGRKMNLKCIDFNTGEVQWVQRPIPWPTCIVAGGRLLIQTLDGELILADASPAGYKEHGRAKLLSGRFWTVPALADGRLFCRNNDGHLWCLRVGGEKGASGAAKPVLPSRVPVEAASEPAHNGRAVYSIPPADAKQWPRFRGPGGAGVAPPGEYPIAWNGHRGEGILWKAPVPLPGYSSPIVWQQRVLLTGATPKSREVYCYDADSGRLLWQQAVENIAGSLPGPTKPWNAASYAAPTPTTDGRRVYAMFANGDVACFDWDGKPVWARNLGLPQNQYGHASSPILHNDLLLIQLDQGTAEEGKSKLLALEAGSGRTVWQVKRPVSAGWSTPTVIEAAGRRQLVASGNYWVAGYDLTDGVELWRADTMKGGYFAVPSPIVAAGMIFAGTEGAKLAAIRPDGKGDVGSTHVVWTAEDDLPNVSSPVGSGELLFLLASEGLLSCHEVRRGKRLWQKDFSGENRSFDASPTLCGNRLYLLDSAGTMWIVDVSKDGPGEVRRAELGEPCSGASPAFAAGRIYLRSEKKVYCIGNQPQRIERSLP